MPTIRLGLTRLRGLLSKSLLPLPLPLGKRAFFVKSTQLLLRFSYPGAQPVGFHWFSHGASLPCQEWLCRDKNSALEPSPDRLLDVDSRSASLPALGVPLQINPRLNPHNGKARPSLSSVSPGPWCPRLSFMKRSSLNRENDTAGLQKSFASPTDKTLLATGLFRGIPGLGQT